MPRALRRTGHAMGKLLLAPISLMIVAEIAIQMIKGTYDFMYPFIMRDDGGSTGWTYFISIVQRLAFLVGMHGSSKQNERGQHLGAIVGLASITALTVHVVASPSAIVFSLALAISALASGLIYGFASQVLLRKARKGEALRVTASYEALSGAGYGIVLLMTSMSSMDDITSIFSSLEWFLAIVLGLFALSFVNSKGARYHREPQSRSFLSLCTGPLALFINPKTVRTANSTRALPMATSWIPLVAIPIDTTKK
jgi:Mn2+/Fe2+ NRAMP family transporter